MVYNMSLLQTISHGSLFLSGLQLGLTGQTICSKMIAFSKSPLTPLIAYNVFKDIETKYNVRNFSKSSTIRLKEITSHDTPSYPFFEKYSFRISILKQRLEKLKAEKKEILQKLSTIPEREEIVNLQEEQLTCIKDPHCRKFVYLTFHYLSNKQELSILELPMLFILNQPIYNQDSNVTIGFVHPLLDDLCKKYYEEMETMDGYHHFGKIVEYLRILKDSNLTGLKRHCLNEELTNLCCLINFYKKPGAILYDDS